MATRGATKRLAKEYQQIQIDPPEFAIAKPSERNILEWHYVITGPPETPYYGGQYYGTLNFPPDYPFKPPSIKMVTPSGRFQCNTRLCLSISDFHPKSWNPSWQVSTILTGLVSFMTSEEMTTGGISTPARARVGYAQDSRRNNIANSTFCREFPELVEANKGVIAQAASLPTQCSDSREGTRMTTDSTTTPGKQEVQGKGLVQRYWISGLGFIVVVAILAALMNDTQ